MSKAFTRESDDLPERPVMRRSGPDLPPGVKNYLTASGARTLREELKRLVQLERPAAGEFPGAADAKQRIQYLQTCLQTAVVIEPAVGPMDQVRFGATVTVRDRAGVETRYRLVGVDETDLDRDWVSWRSPIARALLSARRGERVRFRFPSGEEELKIIDITSE